MSHSSWKQTFLRQSNHKRNKLKTHAISKTRIFEFLLDFIAFPQKYIESRNANVFICRQSACIIV